MEEIHGNDSMIVREIRLILQKVRMNLTFEEALGDFAERSGLDDVRNFADVFLAARKSGGELMKIIARTAEIIGGKDPDSGGDPDSNGIQTHGAEDHERDPGSDRHLY